MQAWSQSLHAQGAWLPDPRQRQGLRRGDSLPAQQQLALWQQQEIAEEEAQEWSSNSEEPSALKLEDYVAHPLRVKEQRPPISDFQMTLGIGFYVQLAMQLLLWLAVWYSQNYLPKGPDGLCQSGFQELEGMCVSNRLYEQRGACKEEWARTHNATDEGWTIDISWLVRDKDHHPVLDLMEKHRDVFPVLLLLTCMICVAWLVLLIFAAGPTTWGMFAVDGVLMLWIFYQTSNWMMLVTAFGLALLVFFTREQIRTAVGAMEVAGRALLAAPAVFPLYLMLMLVWFAYAVSFCWISWTVVPASKGLDRSCDFTKSGIAVLYGLCCPLAFLVTSFFIKNCMLAAISLAVGSFYFSDNARALDVTPNRAAMMGLELALTRSSGPAFTASLVMGVVEELRRAGERSACVCFFWLDPFWWLAKVLWCALQGLINTLSRFALIAHLFQGEKLCDAGSITYDVLRRHLPGAVVTGCVADAAMGHVAVVLSTAAGLGVWWRLDAVELRGSFQSIGEGIRVLLAPPEGGEDDYGPSESQLLSWDILVLTMLMTKAMRNPVQTIILTLMVDRYFNAFLDPFLSIFCFALVAASLVSVIAHFFGHVMEYATDAVFYCSAMEAEGGVRQPRFNDLYRTMKQPELPMSAAEEN